MSKIDELMRYYKSIHFHEALLVVVETRQQRQHFKGKNSSIGTWQVEAGECNENNTRYAHTHYTWQAVAVDEIQSQLNDFISRGVVVKYKCRQTTK